jgi:hypothetical protein
MHQASPPSPRSTRLHARVQQAGGLANFFCFESFLSYHSLPRWIAYWAIGWQIFTTKYCEEIDGIFNQMSLLRDQIGLRMPGNKQYVTDYIETVWQQVTALTSAVERYPNPSPWLVEKYVEYETAKETTLRQRLEKIRYDIDSLDTVNLVVADEPIERVCFI